MNLFNKIRLSYLEDLDNDPQVQQSMDTNSIGRFKYELEDGGSWNLEPLSNEISSGIFKENEAQSCINCLVPVRYAYVKSEGGDSYRLDVRGISQYLSTETDLQRRAIWDSVTKTMTFVNMRILDKILNDQEYKFSFLAALGKVLDNTKNSFETRFILKS